MPKKLPEIFLTIQQLVVTIGWAGVIGLCCLPLPAGAEIYKWVDKNGVMHFTNAPTSSRYRPWKGSGSYLYRIDSYSTDKYDHIITEASQLYGVPFSLLKAVIKVESNFNPRAKSRKGALGLMQIMPFNLDRLNVGDPFDPEDNIMGGTLYLKTLLDRYNGKLKLALAGYNAGPDRVDRYNGIPPFRETQNYVRMVLRYYRHYQKNG